jgi:hypothetical protein
VVLAGDTDIDVSPVTVPTPLLIDRAGAGLPVTDQDSVVDWPAGMDVGVAANEAMAGACPWFTTVIVTVA